MIELPDWFVALMVATAAVYGAVPASGPLAHAQQYAGWPR